MPLVAHAATPHPRRDRRVGPQSWPIGVSQICHAGPPGVTDRLRKTRLPKSPACFVARYTLSPYRLNGAGLSIATTRTESSAGRHSARRGKVGAAAAIAVIACVLVGLLGSILWMSWRNAAAVPISDKWSMGSLLAKAEAGTLAAGDFWAVRNGHRPVLSRLISLPVVLFLDWNRYAHLVIALIIVLISLALQLRAAWTSIPWRPAALIAFVPIPLWRPGSGRPCT